MQPAAIGRRELVFGKPAERLRGYVEGYCGYFDDAAGVVSRVQASSESVGMIVGFGSPVRVAYAGDGQRASRCVTSFVAGLHESYAVVATTGRQQPQHGVQIDLTPIGARMLLGVAMDGIVNRVVELEEVLGRFASRLAEQLDEAVTWPARFAVLDAAIGSRLADAREPSPAISWAWRRLTQTGGRLGISELADEVGVSRQYLSAGFREEIGLPPKTLARIVRFQCAVRRLERDDQARMASISHDCGYYDQAHLNRDFREFAGSTPTEFLARRLHEGAGVLRGGGPDGRG